jgi:hypothetical protein
MQEPTEAAAAENLHAGKSEGASDSGSPPAGEDNDQKYIHGVKLAFVLSSLTLVYFLIMLDNTILATVSWPRDSTENLETSTTQILTMTGNTVHHRRVPLPT